MRKLLIFFLVLLLLIPLVDAAQIFQTNVGSETPSLTIVHPKCIIFAAGNSKSMPFDVVNSSYARLTNTTTACEFFMVDSFGVDVTHGNLNYSQEMGYWHYDLNTTNTVDEGCYSYYVHCNWSGIEFGFISEKITILEGGEVLGNYDNFSFLIVMLVFLFITTMIIIGLFKSEKIWLKVVLTVALALMLTTILRFSSWFMSITNPSETNMIGTLDFFYSIGVRSLYFLIAGACIFLVVMIINAIRDKPEKKREREWHDWGKE